MGFVDQPKKFIDYLCTFSGGDESLFLEKGYVLSDRKALNHVFRVGCGLESQIIGDFEIIGQMKKSFQNSKDHQIVNGFSERLINAVIQASKRIKTETDLSSGATSVSFASVHYILEHVKEVSQKKDENDKDFIMRLQEECDKDPECIGFSIKSDKKDQK